MPKEITPKAFFLHQSSDGGFSRLDVPTIAFRFFDYLGDIMTRIDLQHIHVDTVKRAAFDEGELSAFEDLLRLMLAASTERLGKLRVNGTQWVVDTSNRDTRSPFISSAALRTKANSTNTPPPHSLPQGNTKTLLRSGSTSSSSSSNVGSSIPNSLRYGSLSEYYDSCAHC